MRREEVPPDPVEFTLHSRKLVQNRRTVTTIFDHSADSPQLASGGSEKLADSAAVEGDICFRGHTSARFTVRIGVADHHSTSLYPPQVGWVENKVLSTTDHMPYALEARRSGIRSGLRRGGPDGSVRLPMHIRYTTGR